MSRKGSERTRLQATPQIPFTNRHPDPFTNRHPDPFTNCHPDPFTNCHPDRSIPFPKGMECAVEGPAVVAKLNGPRTLALTNFLAAALIFLALAAPPAQAQKATADLPPGPMQPKATTACTECHEARIILQQRLTKAAWTKEVDKMTKWGALVDAADRDSLIDYLSTNFPPDKPAYDPPRTAGSGKR
jgi:hypothetical protein